MRATIRSLLTSDDQVLSAEVEQSLDSLKHLEKQLTTFEAICSPDLRPQLRNELT